MKPITLITLAILLAQPAFAKDLTIDLVKQMAREFTSMQWDEACRKMHGMPVNWSGWVADVKATRTGGQVFVDLDPPEDLMSTPDLIVQVGSAQARALRKDQAVTARGYVDRVSRMLGVVMVYLQDGAVLQ